MSKLLLTVAFAMMACGVDAPTHADSGPRFKVIYSQPMDGYDLSVICDKENGGLVYHSSSGSVSAMRDTRGLLGCNQ
jgi:hypothetical protein